MEEGSGSSWTSQVRKVWHWPSGVPSLYVQHKSFPEGSQYSRTRLPDVQEWLGWCIHTHLCTSRRSLPPILWLVRNVVCGTLLGFGSISFPGIFDRVAKILIYIVTKVSSFSAYMIIQNLDDCVAWAPEGSDLLEKFDKAFADISKNVLESSWPPNKINQVNWSMNIN